MNTSRGFVSLVLILIVIGLVVLGGAWWWMQFKQTSSTAECRDSSCMPAFSVSPTFGPFPLTVTFLHFSPEAAAGATLHFGDGEKVNSDSDGWPTVDVTHTYKKPGTYTVSLVSSSNVPIGSKIIITVLDPSVPYVYGPGE